MTPSEHGNSMVPARWNPCRKAAITATGSGASALSSVAFYQVRELLAELILFSFLFAVVLLAILTMWLVGEITHQGAAIFEAHLCHLLPHTVTLAPVHPIPSVGGSHGIDGGSTTQARCARVHG